MKSSGRSRLSEVAGYSLVEMMMTLAIGLILVSVALPTMIGAIQAYRLNSVAQQVASLIELTRYTAIRRNTLVSLRKAPPQNGNTVLFIDLDGDGKLGVAEPMVMLPNDMQIAPGGSTPDPKNTVKNPQNFTDTITFDYRGTLNFSPGGATRAYFLVLEYAAEQDQKRYGYRAVTVIPMGQTKTWKAPSDGPWVGM